MGLKGPFELGRKGPFEFQLGLEWCGARHQQRRRWWKGRGRFLLFSNVQGQAITSHDMEEDDADAREREGERWAASDAGEGDECDDVT